MPEGGQIRVHVRRDKQRMVAIVSDDGPGIAEGHRSQVFDTFYTTKQAGAGTGLGLAVVRHLVSEFQGQIEVIDDETGDGTCMRLVIPIEDAAAKDKATRQDKHER